MGRDDAALFGCPVARTAQIISNKWTPLIVRDLARRPCRFTELARSLVGISPKTLAERLRALEAARIVTRQPYAEVPPRVEYTLTEKGLALLPIITTMHTYGSTWLRRECDEATVDTPVEAAS